MGSAACPLPSPTSLSSPSSFPPSRPRADEEHLALESSVEILFLWELFGEKEVLFPSLYLYRGPTIVLCEARGPFIAFRGFRVVSDFSSHFVRLSIRISPPSLFPFRSSGHQSFTLSVSHLLSVHLSVSLFLSLSLSL